MIPNSPPAYIDTSHGRIHFPTYVPVTTFGDRYPLDELIRPYLPRLAQAAMVSLHYARQMSDRPPLPLMIDSGGFASLFEGAVVREEGGLGVLDVVASGVKETLHPRDVLEFQERHADVAFTLDFPISPSAESGEARRRLDLTLANARWALDNRRRRDLRLYACVQGWDLASYRECAEAYAALPFDGAGIGGLVPRARNRDQVLSIVDTVRNALPSLPLHAFGLGNPDLVGELFRRGVQSVDSSSYVKQAADGRMWGCDGLVLADATPTERLHLAICNLSLATRSVLPLSAARLTFGSRLLRPASRSTPVAAQSS